MMVPCFECEEPVDSEDVCGECGFSVCMSCIENHATQCGPPEYEGTMEGGNPGA